MNARSVGDLLNWDNDRSHHGQYTDISKNARGLALAFPPQQEYAYQRKGASMPYIAVLAITLMMVAGSVVYVMRGQHSRKSK